MDLNERFNYDDGLLLSKSGHIYYNMDRDGYIRVRFNGKEHRAHRIIWEMHNGPIPPNMLIDHIDGDVYNNRIENLRIASRQQNNISSLGKGFSGLPKGVTKVTSKYRAKLYHLGRTYCLGTYNSPEEAKLAYDTKAKELHGEFAKNE